MRNILTAILLLAALTVAAQNYSPCYKEKYEAGVSLYNKGDYNGAKAKFVAAKGCPMPNTKEANVWIGKCNAEINRIEEEKRKTEAEAAKRKAEEEQKKQEAEKKAAEAKKKEEEAAEAKRQADEAAKKQSLVFTVNSVTFKMVYVAGGTFTMGCTNEKAFDCADCESFAHSVTLSDYHIGETEVTQALWRAVMGNSPSKHKGDSLPVEQVNWNDCQEFCNKLNNLLRDELPSGCRFALPTEAQWEYAAKGGNKSKGYLYSGSNNVNDVAGCLTIDRFHGNYDGPKPVKTKLPNELGLYDMTGNVEEWCQDWYSKDYFCVSPSKDPPGPPSGEFRVCRSCNWQHCWVICRGRGTPEYRSTEIGFRLSIVHK